MRGIGVSNAALGPLISAVGKMFCILIIYITDPFTSRAAKSSDLVPTEHFKEVGLQLPLRSKVWRFVACVGAIFAVPISVLATASRAERD